MRVALAVIKVSPERERNLAITGLINDGNPVHDLQLGEQIPGPSILRICEAAKEHSIYVALGLFERDGNSLYDSFIVIDPNGAIVLKYRRISRGWRDNRWDESVYREGTDISSLVTPHGSFSVLICGDLFDDRLRQTVKELGVDYLLYPMARNFDDDSYDQARWDSEEKPEYIARGNLTGATLLLVNQLDGNFNSEAGNAFGGALVATGDRAIAELPLGSEGLLVAEVN